MILLFGQTRIRFYYFSENEKMFLLFSIGREYEFTKRGGTGVISSDAAFSVLAVNLVVFHADRLGSGDQLIDARLGDL